MNAAEAQLHANAAEVIADIAFVAGHRHGLGRLQNLTDSRALMADIVQWATAFQKVFAMEVHGDDYMELVDDYAELCLDGDTAAVSAFLERMGAQRPVIGTAVFTLGAMIVDQSPVYAGESVDSESVMERARRSVRMLGISSRPDMPPVSCLSLLERAEKTFYPRGT